MQLRAAVDTQNLHLVWLVLLWLCLDFSVWGSSIIGSSPKEVCLVFSLFYYYFLFQVVTPCFFPSNYELVSIFGTADVCQVLLGYRLGYCCSLLYSLVISVLCHHLSPVRARQIKGLFLKLVTVSCRMQGLGCFTEHFARLRINWVKCFLLLRILLKLDWVACNRVQLSITLSDFVCSTLIASTYQCIMSAWKHK